MHVPLAASTRPRTSKPASPETALPNLPRLATGRLLCFVSPLTLAPHTAHAESSKSNQEHADTRTMCEAGYRATLSKEASGLDQQSCPRAPATDRTSDCPSNKHGNFQACPLMALRRLLGRRAAGAAPAAPTAETAAAPRGAAASAPLRVPHELRDGHLDGRSRAGPRESVARAAAPAGNPPAGSDPSNFSGWGSSEKGPDQWPGGGVSPRIRPESGSPSFNLDATGDE